jgi:hypothetical protein
MASGDFPLGPGSIGLASSRIVCRTWQVSAEFIAEIRLRQLAAAIAEASFDGVWSSVWDGDSLGPSPSPSETQGMAVTDAMMPA